jgi:hypothetical protein
MKQLSILLMLCFPFFLMAQQLQTVTGKVTDKTTRQPIIGASVAVGNTTLGASTDENGYFEIKNVPVGRQTVNCTYIGYQNYISEGFIVSSTKSVALEIELIEGVDVGEVVINAGNNVNQPINELSVVSTRSFSADETDRIAASVNDPGRLALAYPGVSQGPDDTENDIVIRGNSAFGMSWRLEGIDIPNPNHFARPGSSGGGVTIFSAQLLSRSDFSTGGMPAEYGNALSGFMDVHFRKGNMNEPAHRFKLGVLGIDFSTEGPIKEGESSYLVNYRYSTLGILTNMGIYLVGERVTNDFQDLSFNIALDGDEKNRFTIFGIGGLSREHYNPVDNPLERSPINASHWEDRIRDGNMGAIGGTYTRLIDKNSYLKAGIALMGSEIDFYYDVLDSLNNRYNYHDEVHRETRISSSLTYSRRVNDLTRIKIGAFVHNILNYDFYKQTVERRNISDVFTENTSLAVNGQGSTSTYQLYGQVSRDINDKLMVNAGLHFMYFPLNGTTSLEPRLSLKYQADSRSSLSLAYGLHSKLLPLATYFYTSLDTLTNIVSMPNMDLEMVKAHHLIASYNYSTPKGLRLTAEVYYQYLFNVPISPDAENLYWMLNNRPAFPEQAVVSEGKGANYGIDLAAEKFFSNRIYFLLTGSFFKSYFYPQNDEQYYTTYANDFVSAFTFGREFEFKKGRILQAGARILYSGGNRYTPLDEAASLAAGLYVPDVDLTNSAQIPNYFRMDTRVSYRFNGKKLAGNISLDIQNILNTRNPNGIGYSADLNELYFTNHTSGFVPVLAFTFDF